MFFRINDAKEDEATDEKPYKLGEYKTPRSELSYISRFSTAIKTGTPTDLENSEDQCSDTFHPELIVGKVVRLYNFNENNYHTGRVINYRRASTVRSKSDESQFYGTTFKSEDNEIFITEYLIVFNAGLEGRKRTIQQWVVLEEHSIALMFQSVWGYFKSDVSASRKEAYRPGQIVLRTTIEMIPDRSSDTEKAVRNGNNQGLCLFSRDTSALYLHLNSQCFPYLSPFFSNVRLHPPDRSIAITSAVMSADLYEQERVHRWHEIYLKNPFHPKALSLANIDTLPVLNFSHKSNDDNNSDSEIYPKMCPSIPQGLDHLWLCDVASDLNHTYVKETIESFKCKTPKTRTERIQMLIKRKRELGS